MTEGDVWLSGTIRRMCEECPPASQQKKQGEGEKVAGETEEEEEEEEQIPLANVHSKILRKVNKTGVFPIIAPSLVVT